MDADPLGSSSSSFESRFVEGDEGVALRVLSWRPQRPAERPPLVFVAGWVSVVEGWVPLLRELVGDREVHYVETREKRSARIERQRLRPADFSIERMAADLVAVCSKLGVAVSETVIAGSSLGATSVLEAMKDGRLGPRAAFLVAPNSHFHYPWWGPAVISLPAAAYYVVKYPILWYLRFFRVNARKEPEQMRRYDQTLRTAHPQRIKLSAQAVRHYEVWPRLETIRCPVGLAYAPTDSLHGSAGILRMAEAMPRATAIACPSNKYMHSGELKANLDRFLDEHVGEQAAK
ncbi:MAG: alpha/beta fold hydrolase [Myxococcales bacterium]|jgi:pimeloyl-ACP methyl ester carboxylesterase